MLPAKILRHAREFARYIRNFDYEEADDGILFPTARVTLAGEYEDYVGVTPNILPTESLNHILDVALSDPRYSGPLLQGRRVRLPAADVSTFCGSPFDDTDPVTGPVCCATGADKFAARTVPPGTKPRRPCLFAPLSDHAVVAVRLGFTDAAVLRATFDFLTGISNFRVPAGYEPLDGSLCLAARRARPLRHRRVGDSQAAAGSFGIGKRCCIDWTRMFECSHEGNRSGLIFVEAKT